MTDPIRHDEPAPAHVNVTKLVAWAALVLLVLCSVTLAVGIGIWASRMNPREAVEAVEVAAIVALGVLMFVHDHPKNPPPTQRR